MCEQILSRVIHKTEQRKSDCRKKISQKYSNVMKYSNSIKKSHHIFLRISLTNYIRELENSSPFIYCYSPVAQRKRGNMLVWD